MIGHSNRQNDFVSTAQVFIKLTRVITRLKNVIIMSTLITAAEQIMTVDTP